MKGLRDSLIGGSQPSNSRRFNLALAGISNSHQPTPDKRLQVAVHTFNQADSGLQSSGEPGLSGSLSIKGI